MPGVHLECILAKSLHPHCAQQAWGVRDDQSWLFLVPSLQGSLQRDLHLSPKAHTQSKLVTSSTWERTAPLATQLSGFAGRLWASSLGNEMPSLAIGHEQVRLWSVYL